MKQYDLIVIGSGSAMNVVDPMIQENPKIKVAVIDKDEPGGICLTRGCIPSKILLYPAELVRTLEKAGELGIGAEIKEIDFGKIMERMRTLIYEEINAIRKGLSSSENIDYYQSMAEFVSPYTLKVGGDTITSKMIFLCIGSKTIIPPIKGLEETGYLTSDKVLKLTALPKSIAIVGGGYIAAEYGHFFSSMGSRVTILGRNERFLPEEEPEVSALARRELGRHIEILHPEKAEINVTKDGWIAVNEYLETSQPNVWAFGDADGSYLFKHVANYESEVIYYNAVLKRRVKVDYHAIPHAVFTYPEIASVGLKEMEAVQQYGDKVRIGFYKYEDTAKGEAMNVKDYFVKVVIDGSTRRILGAHIIGPYASILIHEIVNVMYTPERSSDTINEAIHIHPALSEVVQRAFGALMPVEHYHHHVLQQMLEESEYRAVPLEKPEKRQGKRIVVKSGSVN